MTDRYVSSIYNDCALWTFQHCDQTPTAVEQQIDSMLSEDNPSDLLFAIVRVAMRRACREQYHSTPSMTAWHELAKAVEVVACDMHALPFGDEGDEAEAA